jgi:hypothetical protein
MSVSCGVAVLSRLTNAPPILIERLLAATGASENAPRKITGDELRRVLERFGLTLKLVREWPRFGGPRLDRWLALRPGYLLSQRLVLLVEERGRPGAHWVAVAGLVGADSFTEAWVGVDGLNGATRVVREAWAAGAR